MIWNIRQYSQSNGSRRSEEGEKASLVLNNGFGSLVGGGERERDGERERAVKHPHKEREQSDEVMNDAEEKSHNDGRSKSPKPIVFSNTSESSVDERAVENR